MAYAGTSGIGAAFITSQSGDAQLAAALWPESVNFKPGILWSATYWLILLSILIVPISTVLTGRLVGASIGDLSMPRIPLPIPIGIATLMSAFCIYKLASVGALSAFEAFDRSVCYQGKILRRIELIGLLGNAFYGIAYSALPILGCYLLSVSIRQKHRGALVAFAIFSILILWIDMAIFFKAAALIYIGALGLTAWLSGIGLIKSMVTTLAAAVTLYIGLSVAQFCNYQPKSWEITIPAKTAAPKIAVPDKAPVQVDQINAPTISKAEPKSPEKSILYKAGYMTRAILFRFAAGIPYYIDTFADPEMRCGIIRPERVWWTSPSCFPPILIFKKMYPSIKYTTGYQPAPVNVVAYAEAGPWYVVFVTLVVGMILGSIASLARDRSPISVSILICSCLTAYYATQTSLTGLLFDSYGMFWLLIPIVAMVALSCALEISKAIGGKWRHQ